MSANFADKDIKTRGYVLRRTNYGEADRILNLITPVGKISAIAKGVRKEKSKLAGGIEVFTLSDFNIHRGRGELGTLTSAKMIKHHSNIVKDYRRMELAYNFMKKIERVSEDSHGAEFFEILEQGLIGIDDGIDVRLVEAWFLLNLKRVMGEEVNLYRDFAGEKLRVDNNYDWDIHEASFGENNNGEYGCDDIKMLRIVATAKLVVARKVKTSDGMLDKILKFARIVTGM